MAAESNSGNVNVIIDTSQFDAALITMQSQSKRSAKVVLKEQVKGFVKNIVALTPPSRSTKTTLGKAKKAGKMKVAADIHKVLQGVPVKQAETKDQGSMKAEMIKHRKRGQVTNESSRKLRVPKTALNAFIKKNQLKVGRLAAGWNKAASAVGVKLPAWITTHSTSGGYKMKVSETTYSITVTNQSSYAANVRRLSSKLPVALNIQANKMRSRTADFAKKAAAKAGFGTS